MRAGIHPPMPATLQALGGEVTAISHARSFVNPLRLAADTPIPPTFATAELPQATGCAWNALSLFSGGGGLDLGFLSQGIKPVAAYDNSRGALGSYAANVPAPAIRADLATYTPPDRADLLLAGAPCQGFSTAGRRAVADPRNALLRRVADICIASRPRVVVVENVPAALSGSHGPLWVALEDRIRLAGYHVARLELKGEESGIAQRRRRLFLLAWRGSGCIRLDLPFFPPPSLRATLSAVDGLDGHAPVRLAEGSSKLAIARAIPPGGKLSNVRNSDRAIPTWSIPEIFGKTSEAERELLVTVSRLRRRARRRNFGDGDPVLFPVLEAEIGRDVVGDVEDLVRRGYLRLIDDGIELGHTYNGKYRRLAWDELAPTVDTRFGRPELFLHPAEHRGLSVREAARVQGFADAYRLPASAKEGYDVIGNAVPPPMAARLATFIREALLKAG